MSKLFFGLLLGLVVFLSACHQPDGSNHPKFHAGDIVKVTSDDFYAGCYGIISQMLSPLGGEREYRIVDVHCGALSYDYIFAIEEHLFIVTPGDK